MKITLQVQGHLKEFFPQLAEPLPLSFDSPVPVREILALAGVPAELPGSVLCSRLRVGLEHVPADGERLLLLSPLAGG